MSLPCAPWPPNHKSLEQEFRRSSEQPSRGMGAYLCVLMVKERSYSVTCYKYCRSDGVRRAWTVQPNPPPSEYAGEENGDLHCIHAQNIWFVVSWSLGRESVNYKKHRRLPHMQNNTSGKFLCIY